MHHLHCPNGLHDTYPEHHFLVIYRDATQRYDIMGTPTRPSSQSSLSWSAILGSPQLRPLDLKFDSPHSASPFPYSITLGLPRRFYFKFSHAYRSFLGIKITGLAVVRNSELSLLLMLLVSQLVAHVVM